MRLGLGSIPFRDAQAWSNRSAQVSDLRNGACRDGRKPAPPERREGSTAGRRSRRGLARSRVAPEHQSRDRGPGRRCVRPSHGRGDHPRLPPASFRRPPRSVGPVARVGGGVGELTLRRNMPVRASDGGRRRPRTAPGVSPAAPLRSRRATAGPRRCDVTPGTGAGTPTRVPRTGAAAARRARSGQGSGPAGPPSCPRRTPPA